MQKDAIELIHHEHVAERKAKLCKEEVIAQKECIAANAEVKTDKIKLSASRTLLKAYGASDAMLNTLFKDLKIFPQIPVLSPIKGTLLEVNIQPGKSVSPSSSIFLIKEDGDYWLESDLTRATAAGLTPSMEVFIRIDGEDIRSRLLHLSPVVNPHNQTRLARFSLPKGHKLIAGTRSNAKLSIGVQALFVDKKAVVQGKGKRVVFIKTGHSYRANPVEVLAENQNGYYLRYDKALKGEIVMGAASVLSNMLDRGE
jgi:membrane fusion protein, heavy metal efflux system